MKKNIAILFSGNGSNLERLIRQLHNKTFIPTNEIPIHESFFISGLKRGFREARDNEDGNKFSINVALALSNKKNAYGVVRAQNQGIKTIVCESKGKDRESFDMELVNILKEHDIELCVLAGFMRILTPNFTNNFKAINIHPSLLPLYKGANGIEDSFNSPMVLGGVSVHYVTSELDSGEIIAQGVIPKYESLEIYEERIHALEHFLYPFALLEAVYRDIYGI
ncbi:MULTISPECIES: phosphoribosylglycinamide formyltransferase [Helicobacter]|uniref:Phosphoribosylglycinamide formyltransferase n=1 Tax=Helicobacter ibis TaxID=2962633 RepID=A0ABT4VFD8_9HELI|nr:MULTISPECIES: phosphoribosylglycinamide formyltransferase [Helicobacter]MDA3967711.1 phosphoribosylglycinamide formyltransferase [Helicobacter sp. WB40]MDA3969429.1 phosphoribosylglycinamide formyltransferase [Helicobacter ibis]